MFLETRQSCIRIHTSIVSTTAMRTTVMNDVAGEVAVAVAGAGAVAAVHKPKSL